MPYRHAQAGAMCVDLSFECVLFSVSEEILSKEACHRNVTYRALSWLRLLRCLEGNVVVLHAFAYRRFFVAFGRWPAFTSAVALILLARLLLLVVRQRQVAQDRALLAFVACLAWQVLHDEMRVAVLTSAVFVRPRYEVKVLAVFALKQVVFENARDVDFDFDGSCHGVEWYVVVSRGFE